MVNVPYGNAKLLSLGFKQDSTNTVNRTWVDLLIPNYVYSSCFL